MCQYQLIIKTRELEKRYQLMSPEEIVLGLSLKLINKTGITLREERPNPHFSFLSRFVPYEFESQYISFADAYEFIPNLKLSNIALSHISNFLDVNTEFSLGFQMNEYNVKLMTANDWDIKCAQSALNKLSRRFSGIHESFHREEALTTIRVDYTEQLGNSGLLKNINSDAEHEPIWNENKTLQINFN